MVSGSESSRISITSGNVTISSQTIQMDGLVTFKGLQNGTTIDGACIRTGTIDAAYPDLTGAIRFSDLSRSLQNDINDAYAMAEDAQSLVLTWTTRWGPGAMGERPTSTAVSS